MGKGQINIDLIFGYLAFVIFIWYFSGYIGDLFTPFMDYAKLEALEKKTLLNRNEIASFVNIDNINNVCNITLEGKYGNNVEYVISGFNLFEKDDFYVSPDETYGGVVFVRDYDSFTIFAGTNASEFNVSLRFTIPYTLVRVDGVDNSENDFYNLSYDDYGNIVFDIGFFTGSSHKLSGFTFHTGFTGDEFLIIEDYTQDMSSLFIGSVKASSSCFAGAESDMLTFHTFFKKLGYGNNEFYGLINVKTWWLDE